METLSAFSLPPGFGFHPTDVELISHYLKGKILGLEIASEVIPEVDIYKHEPWDLPAKCHVPTRDSKWHFFASRDRKYPNGSRSNRATEAGYWKSTGKDRNIRSHNRVIGTKKTLVFHQGRPPCGKRTDWIMHEYYLDESECKAAPGMKDYYVLCRVTKRNGLAMEGENVSPQIEEVDDCPKQTKDLATLVAPVESSSLSENVEDFEAWFTELFDPNFPSISTLSEVQSEAKAAHASLAPKPEPVDLYFFPEVLDGSQVLLPGDNIYGILQSDSQNFDVFGESGIGTLDTIGDHFPCIDNHHESSFLDETDEREKLTALIPNDNNIDTGIQIRERLARPSTDIPSHRIRLQVSKMEMRNRGSISQTVELIDRDLHLDPNDEKQPNIAYRTKKIVIPKESNSRKRSVRPLKNHDGMSCIQGIIGGLFDFFIWCSSAGMNCFFLSVCMIGTAALICYFLLRDVRHFLGSFSALGL